MNYHEALEKIWNKCPFCEIKEEIKIYDYASAYMTIAMAPYWPDHLLVIPKRCVESIFDLTIEEDDEIQWLVRAWMKMLRKLWYTDLSVLVREWMASWKSIHHLHYHVIPNIKIWSTTSNWDRKFLDKDECDNILKKLNSVKI